MNLSPITAVVGKRGAQMDRGKRAAKAKKVFVDEDASCSEAVWQAFSDHLCENEQRLGNRLASGFAGGVDSGDICGAIAGGVMVIGLYHGRDTGAPRNKIIKDMGRKFYEMAREELGSVYCRDLRDIEDPQYRDDCAIIVEKMASLVAKLLAEEEKTSGACPD
jgi:C_GCAxxG_C_C family probable redox protein